jgi:HlyD family secretion protein
MTRKKKILGVVALLAAVATGLGFWCPFGGRERELHLPGVVEIQEVRLSSKVGGRVAKVAAAEGDLVEPGRALVYLEAPELKTQRAQAEARLRAACADLEKARQGPRAEEKAAARAAMKAAESRYEKLEAGPRKEEIDQARADLGSARAELKRGEQELRRTEALFRQRAIARADLDAAVATHGRLRGLADSARARLDVLLAGTRPEEKAEARAEAEKARANYELLEAGTRPEEIAAAEARVAELKGRLNELDVNLREAVVRAPERAVVEVLAVRAGDVVTPNQPVVRVLRAEDLWVKVFVPETELGRVRLNQAVTVTVDAYPGKRFAGTVRQVASVSEFTPRNVQSASERQHQVFAIKVRVADPQGVFKAGMAAEVLLPLHD